MNKYYQILGLEEGASKLEIQDAYDKLSVELDPKNNDNLDFFKEEFALVQEAYKKLMGSISDNIEHTSSDNKAEEIKPEFDNKAIKSVFDDNETLISIFKKYRNSCIEQKKEIVDILEKLKNNNKKYLDALQLIYKTEGVESFEEFTAKQSTKKKETSPKQQEPSKPSGVKKPAKNTDKLLKDNDKNKKIIIRSIVAIFFLFFGITYFIFLNKVEKVKEGIPIIEKKESEKNEQRKKALSGHKKLMY